ncbi:PhnB protein [Crossiella equi]|uniref:PhnB protein n=1 Tax=Crossiella equi TaxID=130796 RepID=A0ABS5AAK6_9PSEU|nr:VOC family protein [Crossiella equi]MBP2473322.1 PhnB protein [Crossiella equi]
MATRLNPYINFGDRAREAMEFYQSVLGGTLNMNTFGDFGGQGEDADKIMHSQLETEAGLTIMGADAPAGMSHTMGDNVSLCLNGDDSAELHRLFDGLADGGSVTVPLEKQMWGDEFGSFVDKFGISWMVNIAGAGG